MENLKWDSGNQIEYNINIVWELDTTLETLLNLP